MSKYTNEELVMMIKANDKPAVLIEAYKNMLVKQMSGYIWKIAHAYNFPGVELVDRYQDGCEGMWMAVDSYNPEKGMFITHATQWIKARVRREGNEQANMIHVPGNVVEQKVKILKVKEFVESNLGVAANIDNLAKALNMKVEHVTEIMSAQAATVESIDAAIEGADGEKMNVADVIGGKTLEAAMDDRLETIVDFMDELPEVDQEIVDHVLGISCDAKSFRQLDGVIMDERGVMMSFTQVNKRWLAAIDYIKARMSGSQDIFVPVVPMPTKDRNKRDVVVALSTELGQALIVGDLDYSQEVPARLEYKLKRDFDIPLMKAEDLLVVVFDTCDAHDVETLIEQAVIEAEQEMGLQAMVTEAA